MLTRPRIIFFQFKLFRLRARVLFGHVKIASVGCAYKLDLKGRWLGHDTYSLMRFIAYLSAEQATLEVQSAKCGKKRKMSSLHQRLFVLPVRGFALFLRDAVDALRR